MRKIRLIMKINMYLQKAMIKGFNALKKLL